MKKQITFVTVLLALTVAAVGCGKSEGSAPCVAQPGKGCVILKSGH
jgi:hypothetical protein